MIEEVQCEIAKIKEMSLDAAGHGYCPSYFME